MKVSFAQMNALCRGHVASEMLYMPLPGEQSLAPKTQVNLIQTICL